MPKKELTRTLGAPLCKQIGIDPEDAQEGNTVDIPEDAIAFLESKNLVADPESKKKSPKKVQGTPNEPNAASGKAPNVAGTDDNKGAK